MAEVKVTEQRRHPRSPICVAIKYGSADEFFEDYARNISAGGMFVESTRTVDFGAKILFMFTLPEIKGPIKGLGEVMRRRQKNGGPDPKSGFGVKFMTFQQESKDKLAKYIEQVIDQEEKKKLMELI